MRSMHVVCIDYATLSKDSTPLVQLQMQTACEKLLPQSQGLGTVINGSVNQ